MKMWMFMFRLLPACGCLAHGVVQGDSSMSWTERSSPTTNHLLTVTYGNGTFVAAGQGGVIVTSTNGMDWVQVNHSAGTADLRAATFGNGLFLLAGSQSQILTSSNAIDWSSQSRGSSNHHFHAATFANGKFVVGGDPGVILASTNASSWTAATVQHVPAVLAFGQGKFVAGTRGASSGDGGFLTSS
ncbi:MAG: WD40/YVTN/BNR-like repeat-containing protein, partial [Limisphaerales bacterium]